MPVCFNIVICPLECNLHLYAWVNIEKMTKILQRKPGPSCMFLAKNVISNCGQMQKSFYVPFHCFMFLFVH